MKKINVIIIDDERSSREELKRELTQYPDMKILAEARNADEAKELIETLHPELIFLDIQMPEKSGFDLLESLNEVPLVIFTTAFNQYAVKAFEINALDYLMKPVRRERFAKAIERVRDKINADQPADKPVNKQLFIRDGERYYFISLNDIHLVESLGNYSSMHVENKKILLRRSLRQWEDILDSNQFFRINRLQIINTNHITKIQSLPNSKLQLTLQTGMLLDVSERQSAKFKHMNSL
jgi:two-component system, LytTR family, response regulator